MANSHYSILEFRVIDRGQNAVEAFILITDPTDFLPIGGWYGAKVPDDISSLQFISDAMTSQSFLQWDRRAPDETTAWQQEQIKQLQEQNMALCMEVARKQIVGNAPANDALRALQLVRLQCGDEITGLIVPSDSRTLDAIVDQAIEGLTK